MFKHYTIIFFVFVFVNLFGAKNESIVYINDTTLQYNVYKQLYIFEDDVDTVNFNMVSEIDSKIPFFLNKSSSAPNLGFTTSNYWFRIKIKNNSTSKKLILELPYPFFNKLFLYLPDSAGNYSYKLVGDHFPFVRREIMHKNFLFELQFSANEIKTIYAHLYCDGEATIFPVRILKTIKLAQNDYLEQITLGFYYGILVFALFLSLFLGSSLNERINYLYLSYIIGIGLFQLSLDGLAFQYLWPNSTWLANHMIPMSGSFAIFFLIKFSHQILSTQKYTPKFCNVLNIIAVADAILFFISFFENPLYAFSLKALNLIGLISNIIILITSIIVFRSGYRPARYFLIAFSLLIIGVLTAMLKNFGLLPRIFISEYSIQMGSGIELIFLSFALSERVKILKDEKQKVQNELFLQLQENNRMQLELNIDLEKKVAERTLEIQEQNAIISEKNKDITDSINYAKRIQEALLSKSESKYLNDENHFILFKPRDIVSGDFYWFSERDKKLVIAAVDCTGHGVPGALMSMIGSTILSNVVNDLGVTNPGKILTEMNFGIQKALKQKLDYTSNKDGMDMSVFTIDFSNKKVYFSGAQRPLYYVKNNELLTIKGSPFSVGGYIENKEKIFEVEEIDFESGDVAYIFTDGYADQFGGSFNKKFMTKNLKQLLLSVSQDQMQSQKNSIKNIFEDWKGKNFQVDDVLMIGVKIN
jgi:hypothetical protein